MPIFNHLCNFLKVFTALKDGTTVPPRGLFYYSQFKTSYIFERFFHFTSNSFFNIIPKAFLNKNIFAVSTTDVPECVTPFSYLKMFRHNFLTFILLD